MASGDSAEILGVFDAARRWGLEAFRLATRPGLVVGAAVSKAGPYDLATPADGAIEQFLREQVRITFPDHAFLGEEEGASAGAGIATDPASSAAWRWIVDPIDGTLNYSTGLAGAACSIAAERNREPVVGVVVDLAARRLFRALRGSGRVLVTELDLVTDLDMTGEALPEHVVTPRTSVGGEGRLFLELGWEELDVVMAEVIAAVARTRPRALRVAGGAAYSLVGVSLQGGCMVGIGLRSWDVAAGLIIAREAGRAVRTWEDGDRIHLIVGTHEDVNELSGLVEASASSWVARHEGAAQRKRAGSGRDMS